MELDGIFITIDEQVYDDWSNIRLNRAGRVGGGGIKRVKKREKKKRSAMNFVPFFFDSPRTVRAVDGWERPRDAG